MNKETERALLVLLGIAVLSKLSDLWSGVSSTLDAANTKLQQGGASLYEALHPSEARHANDLPGPRLKAAEILVLAQNAGFPDPKLAAAVALGESLGYVGAKNINSREYSVGLWQINTKVHPYSPADMRDPVKNAAAAFAIYSKRGWQPWGAYTNGRYKQFKKGILA